MPRGSQTKAICKEGAKIHRNRAKSEVVQGPGAGGPGAEQEALVTEGGHFLCVEVCADREVAGWLRQGGQGWPGRLPPCPTLALYH